jgi:hypothetical protein
MGFDLRQVVAGILTITMFVMLIHMIKRDHFDSVQVRPIFHFNLKFQFFDFFFVLMNNFDTVYVNLSKGLLTLAFLIFFHIPFFFVMNKVYSQEFIYRDLKFYRK